MERDKMSLATGHGASVEGDSRDRTSTDSVHSRFRKNTIYCESCQKEILPGNGHGIKEHFHERHFSDAPCKYCGGKVFVYLEKTAPEKADFKRHFYHKCKKERDWDFAEKIITNLIFDWKVFTVRWTYKKLVNLLSIEIGILSQSQIHCTLDELCLSANEQLYFIFIVN